MSWATIWAIFLQSHLVTLVSMNVLTCLRFLKIFFSISYENLLKKNSYQNLEARKK
jgi:hypothetical protein